MRELSTRQVDRVVVHVKRSTSYCSLRLLPLLTATKYVRDEQYIANHLFCSGYGGVLATIGHHFCRGVFMNFRLALLEESMNTYMEYFELNNDV